MTDTHQHHQTDELLTSLRQLHSELSSAKVRDAVRQLSSEERSEFVARRLELSEAILRLESAQLAEIRRELEHHGEALEQGVTELSESLADLEAKAQWAQGMGKLLSMVAKIAPVI